MEYHKGASLAYAVALLTKIRRGWKGLRDRHRDTGSLQTFINYDCKNSQNLQNYFFKLKFEKLFIKIFKQVYE
jgi:hypothetical protein